jgi:hypothetical protein
MEQQGTAMASSAAKPIHVWEQKYHDIEELYALNEELMQSVELAANPEVQLELLAPLIETIGESADVLSEEYIGLCEGAQVNRTAAKSKIEGSLRKVYIAIAEFNQRTRNARNAAQMIVKKIKRQLEQVIANFVEFVTLSLDRIMQKNDIDELNAHHASIALMLHQAKLGQGA